YGGGLVATVAGDEQDAQHESGLAVVGMIAQPSVKPRLDFSPAPLRRRLLDRRERLLVAAVTSPVEETGGDRDDDEGRHKSRPPPRPTLRSPALANGRW